MSNKNQQHQHALRIQKMPIWPIATHSVCFVCFFVSFNMSDSSDHNNNSICYIVFRDFILNWLHVMQHTIRYIQVFARP